MSLSSFGSRISETSLAGGVRPGSIGTGDGTNNSVIGTLKLKTVSEVLAFLGSKQGWLSKRGGSRKNLRRRYFRVLWSRFQTPQDPSVIFAYYKSDKPNLQPKGSMVIYGDRTDVDIGPRTRDGRATDFFLLVHILCYLQHSVEAFFAHYFASITRAFTFGIHGLVLFICFHLMSYIVKRDTLLKTVFLTVSVYFRGKTEN